MSKHVIVISQDAMVFEDIETIKNLPNFKRVWNRCARINKVRSIYPSITYPCHTTMMTGVYPDRHGIINNEQPVLGEVKSKWVHFRESVKAKTIFDYAHEAGLTTAAVFWPVTGNDPSIDHLMNEYWPQTPDETTEECFRATGSSEDVIEHIIKPNLAVQRHRKHPYCDIFVTHCAADMIRRYKPNLLMVHPANIDAARHSSGVFSDAVTHALHEIDVWFGQIVNACEDAGILDDTDFFIISDHGQMNIVRVVNINVLLAENGFITTDEKGDIVSMKAFCKSAALSTHVYLTDPTDEKTKKELHAFLQKLCDEGVYGISRVYTAEEAKEEEHLAGDFSFVLETDGYTTFGNDWRRPLVRSYDISDYKTGRATHGHHPAKGVQPTFFAFGPDIEEGVVVENARLVDEAPTIARALGLEMVDTDGRVIEEIYKK